MVQEHNVRDLKVSTVNACCLHTEYDVLQVIFAIHGPYATWEYIKKITASIPTQRKLKDHIEREFNHFRRYKGHTTPDFEKDVRNLQGKYAEAKVHVHVAGREVEDKTKDFIAQGLNHESLYGLVSRWATSRMTEKSTMADFDDVKTHIERMDEELRKEAENTMSVE